jgi:hypothetical protein
MHGSSLTPFAVSMAAAVSLHAAQPGLPSDLASLAAKAGVRGTVARWCSGDMRAKGRLGYAAAVTQLSGGGRYVILDASAAVVELAVFTGSPELSCYTPAAARALNESIRTSETISGRVTPLFATTVVCGFVRHTRATCWQYSQKTRAFVHVGGWET